MLATADVTDREAMADVVAEAARRFGRINGVFHCAGVLKDQLIALRAPETESAVLSVKAKGALVLQSLFVDGDLDFLIHFSSVSSILGLPGQVDYTAANAVLDALAKARTARGSQTRTVSINWNAWKEVGMLATLVRERQRAGGERFDPRGLSPRRLRARRRRADAVSLRDAYPNTLAVRRACRQGRAGGHSGHRFPGDRPRGACPSVRRPANRNSRSRIPAAFRCRA